MSARPPAPAWSAGIPAPTFILAFSVSVRKFARDGIARRALILNFFHKTTAEVRAQVSRSCEGRPYPSLLAKGIKGRFATLGARASRPQSRRLRAARPHPKPPSHKGGFVLLSLKQLFGFSVSKKRLTRRRKRSILVVKTNHQGGAASEPAEAIVPLDQPNQQHVPEPQQAAALAAFSFGIDKAKSRPLYAVARSLTFLGIPDTAGGRLRLGFPLSRE